MQRYAVMPKYVVIARLSNLNMVDWSDRTQFNQLWSWVSAMTNGEITSCRVRFSTKQISKTSEHYRVETKNSELLVLRLEGIYIEKL